MSYIKNSVSSNDKLTFLKDYPEKSMVRDKMHQFYDVVLVSCSITLTWLLTALEDICDVSVNNNIKIFITCFSSQPLS